MIVPEMSGVATAVMAILIIASLAAMEIIVFAVGGRSYRHPHPHHEADGIDDRPTAPGGVVQTQDGPTDSRAGTVADSQRLHTPATSDGLAVSQTMPGHEQVSAREPHVMTPPAPRPPAA